VRDGGYRGTVVLVHSPAGVMPPMGELIYAEAGVACPKLARLAATHSSRARVPRRSAGTVGGALAMNAGCYGSETWDVVGKASTVSRAGK